jgi:ectoine hydroxylase-related dioxygenase (phytanoyl-CoA dioxygenase family)
MALLSADEVQFYHQNGYLLYHKPVFHAERLEQLNAIFEEHLAEKGAKLSDELDTPHFRDPRLLEFLMAPEALDLVEALIGPNIGLFSSHFICKDPFVGRATPWHEDSSFWKTRFDRFDRIVTIWLALDPSTRTNGCMRVIPGTHRDGFSEYIPADTGRNLFPEQIRQVDERTAVDFELERGHASLHDSRIIHGAEANASPYRRCGYTMRYFATELHYNYESYPDFHVWLARGKDLGKNRFENATPQGA